MHAVRLISQRFRYVCPSTPQTKRAGFEITDFTAGSYGGQVMEHVTQCGIKFWSSRQCCPTGHCTCLQEAVKIIAYKFRQWKHKAIASHTHGKREPKKENEERKKTKRAKAPETAEAAEQRIDTRNNEKRPTAKMKNEKWMQTSNQLIYMRKPIENSHWNIIHIWYRIWTFISFSGWAIRCIESNLKYVCGYPHNYLLFFLFDLI